MTDHSHPVPAALPSLGRVRPESKVRSYARLGKLDVYDYYLSMAVVVAVVAPPAVQALRAGQLAPVALTLALFLLGEVFVVMAMVALDDVTGFRDGSDARNYGPDHPRRKRLRKPLVAGTLTAREALGFAGATAATGAALWGTAAALAPHRPLWALVLTGVVFAVALQYSYGLRISYRGFQEVFLAGLGAALVIAPYGLVTGSFSGFVLVQGVLFGFGPLLFGVYSNTNDVDGDREAGRLTVAAVTTPRGNAVFVGVLSAAECATAVFASATGLAPWWFVLWMAPVTVLRVRQYLTGFPPGGAEGDIMKARRRGFVVHRLATVLLIGANLLAAVLHWAPNSASGGGT
ncbi:UbiA family prenyltransferase [Streptomyces sp. MMBL 11-3]|uniref:UbiA family prenyltransferase n=1 Tax=Streptomyces sp. MMBL 11-3 TaxID=3382639 RepID=UPI0039B5EEE3